MKYNVSMLERVHIVSLNSLDWQSLLILSNFPKNGKNASHESQVFKTILKAPLMTQMSTTSPTPTSCGEHDHMLSDAYWICWCRYWGIGYSMNEAVSPDKYRQSSLWNRTTVCLRWFSHRISNLQLFATSEGKFFYL